MTASTAMSAAIDRFLASLGLCPPEEFDLAARWELLRAAGVERPGDEFAAWLDVGLLGGLLPGVLANCRDVETMLRTLARFHPMWGDDEVRLEPDGDGLVAALRRPDGTPVHTDTIDAFAALLARIVERLVDGGAAPSRVARGLRFGPASLSSRLHGADPAAAAVLAGFVESDLASQRGVVSLVRSALRREAGPYPDLVEVASQLAMSTRLLQQQLAEAGTSFSALLDDERRVLALGLLAGSDAAVTQIALRCGFESPEGFARAVRRWTGQSPTSWRAARSVQNRAAGD